MHSVDQELSTLLHQGTPRAPLASMVCWKDSQNSEKLLHSWLWFITAEAYRLESEKNFKVQRVESEEMVYYKGQSPDARDRK